MTEQNNNPYAQGLEKCAANYVPLSPLSYLERSAYVYPDRVSVIHGSRSFTWSETYGRCRRLASALADKGIGRGDTVAVMLSNV
ncbi:MAG: AMP-binding protein, partial [Rhodocyclaceae bacterium]|nr:AMP-binding protein [Rhodocyclaceae bacterium]